MDNEDGYFDELTAARYDERSADMFRNVATHLEPGAASSSSSGSRSCEGSPRAERPALGRSLTSDSPRHVSIWEKPAPAR